MIVDLKVETQEDHQDRIPKVDLRVRIEEINHALQIK
jgi:hypothetical protein